jgi:hypothetical protein
VLYTFRKLLNHYASATLIDVLHSPFIFGLYNHCFKKNSILSIANYKPSSNGYFNQRCENIIEKLQLHFPNHSFIKELDTLPLESPFILLINETISLIKVEQILSDAHNDSMLIVRNIYSNSNNTQRWEQLKSLPQVTASIDLFFMGLLFVREEQRKQVFKLRLF